MLTRAKSLLVIVGDPHTLSKDANWNYVIQFCILNESFIQSNNYFSNVNENLNENK